MTSDVIGVGGLLRHGKDEIADHLVNEYGWTKIGMSDALADALYVLNPIITVPEEVEDVQGVPVWKFWKKPQVLKSTVVQNVRYAYYVDKVGYTKAKENPEVRRLLQKLGTDVGRKMIGTNVWVNIMTKKVREAKKNGAPGVVITGVRFPNEAKAIRSLDGELWWVKRPLENSGDSAIHESENSLTEEDFDKVIDNDSSLNALRSKVDDMVE